VPRFELRVRAKQDIDAIADYLEGESWQLAERFLQSLQDTLHMLADRPLAGVAAPSARYVKLRRMRRFRVNGFDKYLIFYLPRRSGPTVIRVLHGARDLERIFNL
jgi:toxin ParE1/3/4